MYYLDLAEVVQEWLSVAATLKYLEKNQHRNQTSYRKNLKLPGQTGQALIQVHVRSQDENRHNSTHTIALNTTTKNCRKRFRPTRKNVTEIEDRGGTRDNRK